MAVYIPFVFVAAWIIGRFGLRTGLLLGAGLNAAGAAVRKSHLMHALCLSICERVM